MLITFQPEDSKDFSVDGGGSSKPPIGTYNETIQIVNIEEGFTRNNLPKVDVTFEFMTSIKPEDVPIGFQFVDNINIGAQNLIPAQIARQTLAKLIYATTGDKNIIASGRATFDENNLNKPFKASFVCKETPGGTDDQGKPKMYKNINFGKVVPMGDASQSQQTGNNNQQPAQNTTTAWGQK